MANALNQPGELTRRPFLKRVLAGLLGATALLPPGAAGLCVFLDPLRRGAGAGTLLRVTTLAALPEDGTPRRFAVLASRRDAWTRSSHEALGAVFLRRTGPETAEALHAVCPHAGCQVVFAPESRGFLCPCHKSSFDLAGRIAQPNSPSPRDMDTLEIEIRGREIWIRFQNFRSGSARKIPV
ncbi:MAG: Rieske 2Fe-2S domain-containing protein [Halieaceae bacterium]|jgi:Rieske Fe-S protein|nr:Rieske 2Fe-2S domain-containing protein [Halieaceae bacterium]